MNDNEQNFSNTPYKATRNLNTIIENPDINVNSATTVNIMSNPYNNTEQNSVNPSMLNSNTLNDVQVFTNVDNFSFNSNNNNTLQNESNNIITPVPNLVNENNNVVDANSVSNVNVISNDINKVNVNDNYTTKSIQEVYSNNFNNNIKYENTYQTNNKKQSKSQTVSIPSEFKTAILVVLILLIGVFCFDIIYDFFRNLDIFG